MGRTTRAIDSSETATVIALADLRRNPARYAWAPFKPGVEKLILSGTADARHVSVLWYREGGAPGSVPVHRHPRTEAIFVIDGAQSDSRGRYERGGFCFNPPGSRHHVFDSAGLFLLSYAAPPDFSGAPACASYESVVVGVDYDALAYAPCADGLCHALPLATGGGLSGRFVRPHAERVALTASVLLLLRGTCVVAGEARAADTLVVTRHTEPAPYVVASASRDCLLFQLAFE